MTMAVPPPAIRAFLALCALSCFALGCGSSEFSGTDVRVMVGTIYVTGNEPFTRLALRTDDGVSYLLKCPKEVENLLGRAQGMMYAISFSAIEQSPEGPVLSVLTAKPVRQ